MLSLEDGTVECRSMVSDGLVLLHECACRLVLPSDKYDLGLVSPTPLQGIQTRIAAGLHRGDCDGRIVVNCTPFAVLHVLFVQDGIDHIVLIGQVCLLTFSGQEVVLNPPAAKGWVGPIRVGTGPDGADLRLQLFSKFCLFFDLLIRDEDEDGHGVNT